MDLAGWPIDLKSVYGWLLWRKRSRFYLGDKLYESPDAAFGVLFFGIGELGVNRQAGFLALFKDKSAPRLAWRSGFKRFWYEGHEGEPIAFSADGKTARVFQFQSSWLGKLSARERVLDLAAGKLL